MARAETSGPMRLLWGLYNTLRALVAVVWCGAGMSLGLGLRILIGSQRATLRIARRYWAPFLTWIARADVEVRGVEHVSTGTAQVFVANHQSILDIPLTIQFIPVDVYFAAKKELGDLPFLGKYLRGMGMVLVDRQGKRASVAAVRAIRCLLMNGKSLVCFPEGTRSRTGQLQEFKRGIFMSAIAASALVVPVAISGSKRVLPFELSRARPGRVRLEFGEPVPTEGLRLGDRHWLAEECRARISRMLDEDLPAKSSTGQLARAELCLSPTEPGIRT